jgi:hypothetical protein
VKVYRGSAAAARNYVEAGRCRADDYYLAEGVGIAQRLSVDADGRVVELVGLSGDGYEAWVAGVDPVTGEPRGRLRADAHAVRFVEVVVNGPKSWSIAAGLHPDVAAAFEAAQDRAARQILGWVGQHATTRVGPRGVQVAVPVERLEAAVVRHYTSRAGDPHRHLHVQVNARVFAAGRWRGLDTVAFRDSIAAINGIGHAAVACDPEFRAALASHGYSLTETGEIAQLAGYVGPFSKRAAQIGRLIDRYEAVWRAEHPGQEPGPGLRRGWDARAWATDRPDKLIPRDGAELRQRWLTELAALGYRDTDRPVQLALTLPGTVDRDAAAAEVIARLGAGRSAWNPADLRGAVEQLLARAGVIAEPPARAELAEDLTARALDVCVPLRPDAVTPEHIRALTSRNVLEVEADLTARLAARGAHPVTPVVAVGVDDLDDTQRAAAAVLASDARLVVVEGAAGAGKTTLLAATRDLLAGHGRRLVVVTPTLKAAQTASTELHARAGSAARLAYQHGWRWNDTGTWTRVAHTPAPGAVLSPGDLLLCDEAGMLDQDTARALVTIADESGARVALVGDRHQLPAVGRGGVLDLAHRWAHPDAVVGLDTVHRFVHTVDGVSVPDTEYAELSLRMRAGEDPAEVFDALATRGHIIVHASEIDRQDALATRLAVDRAAGGNPALVVDTREHADTLNAVVRNHLIAAGQVDDRRVVVTRAGQRIGAGDLIVTRRNHAQLGVANREAWTVTRVHRDGHLTVTDPDRGTRELPVDYLRAHVELGYAVTAYGSQGDTTDTAHLVVTDDTTAASAYVAMTRGRQNNTAHLVADNVDDAREQWISVFSRNRADLGPSHAAHAAQNAAAGYTPASVPPPATRPEMPVPAGRDELAAALGKLEPAWAEQAAARRDLHRVERELAETEAEAAWWARCGPILTPLAERSDAAYAAKEAAERAVADGYSVHLLEDATQRNAQQLRYHWDSALAKAEQAARVVAAGPGRLGLHRGRVRQAQQVLDGWAADWAPVLAHLDLDVDAVRRHPAHYPSAVAHIGTGLYQHAERLAAARLPEHTQRVQAREQARADYQQAAHAYQQARRELVGDTGWPDYDTGAAQQLPALREQAADAWHRAERADRRVDELARDPAITGQPDPAAVLGQHREHWQQQRAAAAAQRRHELEAHRQVSRRLEPPPYTPHISPRGPSIGR